MKFELKDDTVLALGAVASASYGLPFLIAPKKAQEFFYTETAAKGDITSSRWFGVAITSFAANTALSCTKDVMTPEGKKKALKLGAVCWGGALANATVNVCVKKSHKQDAIGYGNLGGLALLTALHAVQGFRKIDNGKKDEPAVAKETKKDKKEAKKAK